MKQDYVIIPKNIITLKRNPKLNDDFYDTNLRSPGWLPLMSGTTRVAFRNLATTTASAIYGLQSQHLKIRSNTNQNINIYIIDSFVSIPGKHGIRVHLLTKN